MGAKCKANSQQNLELLSLILLYSVIPQQEDK